MELRFIIQILNRIGLLTAKTEDALKTEDRELLTWVASNISVVDIVAIETSDEPIKIYAHWISRFRTAQQEIPIAATPKPKPKLKQKSKTVSKVKPASPVVIEPADAAFEASESRRSDLIEEKDTESCEPDDKDEEIEGFSHSVLYPHKAPHSHELVPRSFFGLPIFSTHDPGTSFEHIDKKAMKYIVDTLSLEIDEPELLGVTLDPKFDAALFRAILSKLRGAPHDDFEERLDGLVVQEGRMHAVDYRTLVDNDKYSENTLRSTQFVDMVDRSCKRISQFRLAYKVDEGNERLARYMPFFSHLQFNITTQKIEFIGSSLIPQLFRDDKTLSLNTRTLNLSNGKLESSLLYYLTSLPRGYSTDRKVPIKHPVPILALLTRCYPKISPEKLNKDYARIERVKSAMLSLKEKSLISYEINGRGKNIIFVNVLHYCEMSDGEFNSQEKLFISPAKTGNTLKHYLESEVAPRRASDEQKLAYGERVIPNALALIDDSSDEHLIESFRGVVKPKLLLLRKYAELIGEDKMIQVVNRMLSIRDLSV